jgi:hypothetical protein
VLTIVASGVFTMAILVLLLALIWLFKREEINNVLIIQLRGVIWRTGLLVLFYFDGSFIAVPIAQGHVVTDAVTSLLYTGALFVVAVASGELMGYALRRAKSVVLREVVRITTQSAFFPPSSHVRACSTFSKMRTKPAVAHGMCLRTKGGGSGR